MKVKSFCGLLPEKNLVKEIISPPYDVVSREDVRTIISKNKYSFLRITRADAEFDDSIDEHDNLVYQKARQNLLDFIKKGILLKDDREYFYLLSQTLDGKTQNGFYALFRCKDYENGFIKKHELTRKDKEEDRTKHIMITKADTGPVFLFFKNKPDFKEMVKKIKSDPPFYSFTDENGVLNELWKVKVDDSIYSFFDSVDYFYIADGHHRAASAVNVWRKMGRPENSLYSYFYGVVFDASELTIYPYNRVVKDLNNLSKEDFFQKIKENFIISSEKSDLKKGEIGIYMDGEEFKIIFKHFDRLDNPIDRLDVSILQNYLLDPILGIKDPRTSDRIYFVGGKEAKARQKEDVDKSNGKIAFFLPPVNINELIEIADQNEIMPPKSTWFEPKLKDGLVTYMME